MTRRRVLAAVHAGVWMLVLVTSGCGPSDSLQSGTPDGVSALAVSDQGVPPLSLPDLSSMEEWVQNEVRERHATLQDLRSKNPKASDVQIASAYGSLGLVLMAAKQYEAAAASYLNANALAAHDMRWPYYLGQLRLITQDRSEAAEWFERVLELAPSDEAALVSLARLYFDQGRFREADRLFTHATVIEPRSAAAWAGLGQTALADGDYRRAAESLERALEIDPGGGRAHYPLAMAYRALGERDLAAAHLERRGSRQPRLSDPLMLVYYDVLESAMMLERRGNQALEDGDYQTAIDFFRRGIDLEPNNSSVRQRLAAALVMTGDRQGAVEQLEEALRHAPDFAEAHVGLAALLELDGQLPEAIDRYALAVKYEPRYVEARLGLALALHASRQLEEALPHYLQVAETEPSVVEAWIGRAEVLILLERYAEAREWMNAARRVHPDQPDLRQLDELFTAASRP